jgi:hypothetical protein
MSAAQGGRKPDDDAPWWEEAPPLAALDFGLATTPEDFEGAFRLLHDRYVWRGYMAPQASGQRLGVHNLLPSTKVMVARAGDRVVGTITVVEDSCLGLPMDEAFGAELGGLRGGGRRLAEAASLAVCRTEGVSGVAVVVRLLRLAILYAALIARLDRLCFTVTPRHRDFYPRLFPMRRFKASQTYRRVNDAQVLGLYLDLKLVRALIRMERAGLSTGPAGRFLCGPAASEIAVRLRRELPRTALSPVEWARFFPEAGLRAETVPAAFVTAAPVPAEQRR